MVNGSDVPSKRQLKCGRLTWSCSISGVAQSRESPGDFSQSRAAVSMQRGFSSRQLSWKVPIQSTTVQGGCWRCVKAEYILRKTIWSDHLLCIQILTRLRLSREWMLPYSYHRLQAIRQRCWAKSSSQTKY